MCRVEDCDPWAVYRETTRTARKPHLCFECGRIIAKGERYRYATGKHPDNPRGGWDEFKLCVHCNAAAQWLIVMCNGYLFGGIGEELREHWDEEWRLRSVGLARLIIGIDNRWRRSKYATGLIEVPDWAGDCARETLKRNKVAA